MKSFVCTCEQTHHNTSGTMVLLINNHWRNRTASSACQRYPRGRKYAPQRRYHQDLVCLAQTASRVPLAVVARVPTRESGISVATAQALTSLRYCHPRTHASQATYRFPWSVFFIRLVLVIAFSAVACTSVRCKHRPA